MKPSIITTVATLSIFLCSCGSIESNKQISSSSMGENMYVKNSCSNPNSWSESYANRYGYEVNSDKDNQTINKLEIPGIHIPKSIQNRIKENQEKAFKISDSTVLSNTGNKVPGVYIPMHIRKRLIKREDLALFSSIKK